VKYDQLLQEYAYSCCTCILQYLNQFSELYRFIVGAFFETQCRTRQKTMSELTVYLSVTVHVCIVFVVCR